jgi:hypothetical protein
MGVDTACRPQTVSSHADFIYDQLLVAFDRACLAGSHRPELLEPARLHCSYEFSCRLALHVSCGWCPNTTQFKDDPRQSHSLVDLGRHVLDHVCGVGLAVAHRSLVDSGRVTGYPEVTS